jgi:hypothetical protein
MKKSNLHMLQLGVGLLLTLPLMARAAPGIVGSPHDFTATTNFWVGGVTNWVPNGDVCSECHTIHNTKAGQTAYRAAGPLWVHTVSTETYTPFTSATLSAAGYPAGGTPGWGSLACLSCHDGSVAINSQNGKLVGSGTTSVFVPSWAVIAVGGTDLSGTHPIGIDYTTVRTALPNELNDPTTLVANAGVDSGVKSIAGELLYNETAQSGAATAVECCSCHDIHQRIGMSGTLKDSIKIGTATSITPLCITCHIK